MSGAIIATTNEIISQTIYNKKNKNTLFIKQMVNNIKIGAIYGLFVDAFKLGS